MIKRKSSRDLAGKVIDAHSHIGISIKAYATTEYPYAQTIEGLYYRQLVAGVDVNVVFPFTADLYFEPRELSRGTMTPAEHPLSPVPYEAENRLLAREVYEFCPELSDRFLPFVCIDPGREPGGQIKGLERLVSEYPIYGMKVNPVGCQSPVVRLLGKGGSLLDFAEEHDMPLLFHATTDPNERYSQAKDVLRIAEERPGLRFCIAHCIIFSKDLLRRADALPNVWVDTAAMKIQVDSFLSGKGTLFDESYAIDADFSDYRRVFRTLCESFPETMVWGTDAPAYSFICRRREGRGVYRDFNLKATYEEETAVLDAISSKTKRQVTNINTRRFLFG